VNRTVGNRILPEFCYSAFLSLCLILAIAGCNKSSYTPPPPPDTTPPSAPGNLTVSPFSPTQINLSWSPSSDNVAVTGYDVERCSGANCSNFVQILSQQALTYSDMGLTGSTSYSYRVRATDAAGNLSAYSNSSTATTPVPPISVGLSLTAASVQAGIGSQLFTATVQNDPQGKGVNWTLTQSNANCSPTCGTLSATTSASGTPITYIAPLTQPAPSIVTLTAASISDSSKTALATITVTPPVAITVAPPTINVQANSIQSFTATITNDLQNQGATWTLTQSGANCVPTCGTLSTTSSVSGAAINYIGPATVPANPAVTLTAKSVADSSKSAPAAITVTVNSGNVGISISPKQAAITSSQTQTFVATVTATTNTLVNWRVDTILNGNATVGTVDPNGKYTPPATPGAHVVTATSQADVTKTASASIGITDLTGVTTYHNDLSRDGANTHEFALTTANVTTTTFGKLFSCSVDGEVYAQPLWVPSLSIGGGIHNVIFVATENDSVYAFDADDPSCHQYWTTPFLGPGVAVVLPSDTGEGGDINKTIGITGTPVIDPVGKTLYVVAKTKEGTANFHQRLHALNLATGTDRVTPFDITSSITVPGAADTGDSTVGCTSTAGNVPFCPLRENQRPGLVLANGVVYVAWASHGDTPPYHGWVISFDPATLALQKVLNVSPDATGNSGRESGIWMAGGAPSVDSSGNLYLITGNGTFDANSTTAPNRDYGDSFLRISNTLSVLDYFTPMDESNLEINDLDLGSGGAVVLLDLPVSAPVRHLLVGGGKGSGFGGELYVVNRDNMGHFNAGTDNVVQKFSPGGAIFSTAAFWQNTLYIAGVNQQLKAYTLNTSNSTFNQPAASLSVNFYGFPGTTPSVSSSGSSNGIVWALDTHSNGTPNGSASAPAILHAYDATNIGIELWNSTKGTGNDAGSAVKFCVPTVANGRVYVGTQTELTVYGLLP
jgi:hypothetical protein